VSIELKRGWCKVAKARMLIKSCDWLGLRDKLSGHPMAGGVEGRVERACIASRAQAYTLCVLGMTGCMKPARVARSIRKKTSEKVE
jgi:hypothetical protein